MVIEERNSISIETNSQFEYSNEEMREHAIVNRRSRRREYRYQFQRCPWVVGLVRHRLDRQRRKTHRFCRSQWQRSDLACD